MDLVPLFLSPICPQDPPSPAPSGRSAPLRVGGQSVTIARSRGPSTGRPHSLRSARVAPRRCTPCPLASLQSWRLPGLLFLCGTLDDHDRLGTRRSSSARKCSSRRAAHHAPRTEGWPCATPQTTPTARRFAPPPAPSGGGQWRAIGPAGGIGKYPSGLVVRE